MGINGITLQMFALREIEAESSADEGTAGFRVGIGGEDPTLMTVVAEDAHQVGEAELDFGVAEVEQGLDGWRWDGNFRIGRSRGNRQGCGWLRLAGS